MQASSPASQSEPAQATPVRWTVSRFDAFSPADLYALLRLRSAVFVVEQACAFQDLDDADQQALHVQGHIADRLVACARCCGPGVKYPEASIGRIATHLEARGRGLGHLLVDRSIAVIASNWGAQSIRIGAQTRLQRFYEQHGFQDAGLPYIEDGIAHLEMLRHASVSPAFPADGREPTP